MSKALDKSMQKLAASPHKQKLTWLQKGRHIWVTKVNNNPEEIFLQAKVLDFKQTSDKVNIQLIKDNSTCVITLDNCYKLTYGPNDVSDMVDLEQLNEPQLLYNIKRRYIDDSIFTYCGPTLLIINPYCKIEKLFLESILHEYQMQVFSESLEYKSQLPHIYGLAGFCLWQLFDNNRNQSIVISGESGAGKTENTKFCLNFLASLGKNLRQLSPERLNRKGSTLQGRNIERAIRRVSSKLTGIEDKILGCNEILEAFGNSKTIRNDNSSRFGKLIILIYGETQVDIRSAFITNYLLQKSRIVSLSEGERNYHIFYYFCKGASPQQRKKFRLTEPPEGYYFLNQSTIFQISNVPGNTDQDKYKMIKHEFEMYLTSEEIDAVLSIVAAVLNVGNIRFSVKQNQKKQEIIVIEREEFLVNAASLINIKPQDLAKSLTYRTRKLAGSIVDSPLRLDEALALRDSFSKNLYEKLFSFLVFKLNDKIQLEKMDMDDLSQNRANRRSIGILDIFGFEILKKNSLEQFFINFANEKLQQLYVSYIFKEQQNEFLKQGLKQFAYEFDFQDNQPIIDLIQNYPLGILHLISQSSELNKPDSSLPNTIFKRHQKTNIISIPRSKPQFFQVNHSCSPVQYNVIGFTAKNKDEFPAQMLEIVSKIQNKTLNYIINFDSDKPDPNRKTMATAKKFLGTKFLQQMNRLVEELHSCDCHFVRCIKPNEVKKPKIFNSGMVLQSLRNLGVLDSIRIRKLGYVYRRPFHQFYKKFYEIESYNYNYSRAVQGKTEDDFKQLSKKLVMRWVPGELKQNHILFGKQKIMIKQATLNTLQSLAKQKRRLRVSVANRLKTIFLKGKFRQGVNKFFHGLRIFKERMKKFKEKIQQKIRLKKIMKVQRVCKQFLIHIRFKKIEAIATKSAYTIGKWWKMVIQRRKFLNIKKKAIEAQAAIRMYLTTCKLYKSRLGKNLVNQVLQKVWQKIRTKKAIQIQAWVRGCITREHYKKVIEQIQIKKQEAIIKMKVIKIQKMWRYRKFKQALLKYHNAIQLIQAHWRGKLLRRTYQLVRKSAILIQKVVKKHLMKQYYIAQHWKKQKQHFQRLEVLRNRELTSLGLSLKPIKQLSKTLEQASSRTQTASPSQTHLKFFKNAQEAEMDPINRTIPKISGVPINVSDKNDYQCYLLDFDLLSDVSQFYNEEWSAGYKASVKDMLQKSEYPIRIDVSQTFTLTTTQKGRIYAFGQIQPQDKLFTTLDIQQPYRIICNGANGYIFSTNRNLFQWGDNYDGQLMNGLQTKSKGMVLNSYLPLEKITDFEVRGSNKYLLAQGKAFEYVHPVNPEKQGSRLILRNPISFSEKIDVKGVVASINFVHFLSTSGQLFSKGANQRGQLGLGHANKINDRPQINTYLRDRKQIIEAVSVGAKHTVCRGRLGYGYVWGDNSYRQTGGKQQYYTHPQLVDIEKPNSKCLHFVAGYRCSVILLESMKMYGWGTCSSLSLESKPVKIDYERVSLGGQGMIPVKLAATWSNGLSIIYMNAVHIERCRKGNPTTRELINKTVKILSKQWETNVIFPPYNQNAEIHLNLPDLKRHKFKPAELRPGQVIPSNQELIQHSIEDVNLLVELRRNSSTFNLTAKQKFQQILNGLLAKDVGQWTEDDQRMYEYLQNPKIQQIIKKM